MDGGHRFIRTFSGSMPENITQDEISSVMETFNGHFVFLSVPLSFATGGVA